MLQQIDGWLYNLCCVFKAMCHQDNNSRKDVSIGASNVLFAKGEGQMAFPLFTLIALPSRAYWHSSSCDTLQAFKRRLDSMTL